MEIEDTSQYSGVIYGLHAGDFDFRYVGLTIQKLSERIRNHKKESRLGNHTAVYQWMRKHVDSVQVCVIETFDAETINLIAGREIFHIAQARAYYSENLNLTDGGDGHTGHTHSEETRAKIRAARSKQVITEETKAKMSLAHLGNTNLAMGPHTRWHVARNTINPNCNFCKEA